MKRSVWLIGSLALTVLLAGCGNDDDSSSAPATVNGTFADDPVDGLAYECGGPVATTASGGGFTCPTGNVVTFSVGDIVVCSQTVQAVITPLSCVQSTDPSANTSTPEVVRIAQFLQSIDTTPGTGTITITQAEQDAAVGQSLDFATATQTDLQDAVTAISPGATLVDPVTAEAELTDTVLASVAGNYSGTWSGSGISGTWSITIAANGSVTGTATGPDGTDDVVGDLVSGTSYAGVAGPADWFGTLDTSKDPVEFSGDWDDGAGSSGTFTGTAD